MAGRSRPKRALSESGIWPEGSEAWDCGGGALAAGGSDCNMGPLGTDDGAGAGVEGDAFGAGAGVPFGTSAGGRSGANESKD